MITMLDRPIEPVKVGEKYKGKTNSYYRFTVLCVADNDCFVEWWDGTHSMLEVHTVANVYEKEEK